MRKTIKIILLMIFVAGIGISSALAQNCDADYEVIVNLKKPRPGSFTVWDGVLGEKEFHDTFLAVGALPGGHVMVAGIKERQDQKNVGPTLLGKKMILGEIDMRGRIVWHEMHDIKGLDTIYDMVVHERGSVVLASRKLENKNKEMLVLFFGTDGSLSKTKTIGERGHDLTPTDMVRGWDEKSFFIVATTVNKKSGMSSSHFYRLSQKGNVLTQRSLKTGLDNRLLSIEKTDGQRYIATGHIQGENGQATGWALKLAKEGDIIWQRTYPRGAGARLMSAVDYYDRRILLGGQVLPTDERGSAGWLMMVNRDNGDTLWQRYYNSEGMNYAVEDLLLSDKSDFGSVMMNGTPVDGAYKMLKDNVVRVLSLSAQGKIYDMQDYANGEGAQGQHMILNKRHDRVIVGTTQVAYEIESEKEDGSPPQFERSMEGWIMAAPKPETYRDPCRRMISKKPDSAPSMETIFP